KCAELFLGITLCFIRSILAVSVLVPCLLFLLIKTHACIPKSSVKDLRGWEGARVSIGFLPSERSKVFYSLCLVTAAARSRAFSFPSREMNTFRVWSLGAWMR